jgi:hypothetical protein
VSIDTELIVWITQVTISRGRPTTIIHRQVEGEGTGKRMKDKYDTFRGAHSLDIASINDDTVRFTM